VRARRSAHAARLSGVGTVQAWVLPHVIAWVENQGIDTDPIRRLPGLENLSDPDARVSESTAESVWRLAAALTQDAVIGVHVAETLPRGALDLVEYAFRSSASLAVALGRLARYGRVLSDRVAARVEAGSGHGLLLLVRDTGNAPLHPGRADFALTAALRFAREATGENITPLHVCFTHPAPDDTSEYRRFFRIPVRFSAGSNSMLVSAIDAARPLRGADEALSSVVRRRLDKILSERRPHGSGPLGGHVRRMVVEHLGATPLTPAVAASALGVSRRTFSRRLTAEDTSFRAILDDVRREFACALLHDRSLSIADVAFFLQYSEPAAFNRSFRRWTGRTPSDFRNG